MTIVNLDDIASIGSASMHSGDLLTFDPLVVNKFSLIIPNQENVTFFLQQFSLPSVDVAEVIVNTRHVDMNEIGEKMQFNPFTVNILVDKYCRNWSAIYNWMKQMTVDGSIVGKTEDIILMVDGKEFIRFYGCWPASLSGFNMDSTIESVQYLKATLTFNYDYFDLIGEFATGDSVYK